MAKSVMISIQPKWCELIARGKKTIEIRKTRPKLESPFKCYIYCTKGNIDYVPSKIWWKADSTGFQWIMNGRVIGEFVCNFIYEFTEENQEFCGPSYDAIQLTPKELSDYTNGKTVYGWHISDLVIYDKPKELIDFMVEGECYPPRCSKCKYFDRGNQYNVEDDCLLPYHLNEDGNDVKPLFRPPQSWCYVEELGGDHR